ncbi:MAG: transposase [Gemmatimonadetes bacterium]|nr:transposase [Gemmatimonadota bacterium]
MRFEIAPGEQAKSTSRTAAFLGHPLRALIVVLGYSRLPGSASIPARICGRCSTRLAACLDDWGGVPRHLLFDQMRSVLTRDDRFAGGGLLTNPECQRFAQHYGFRLRVCRPYRAQTKGKVERPIRYLRGSFLYGRTFVSDADLNAQVAHWLDTVANPRRGARHHRGGPRGALPGRGAGAAAARCRCGPMCRSCRPHAPCPRVRSRCPRLSWSTGASPPTRRSRGWGLTRRAPTAPSLRERVQAQLVDLKMPGALEALDDVLRRCDDGALAPARPSPPCSAPTSSCAMRAACRPPCGVRGSRP